MQKEKNYFLIAPNNNEGNKLIYIHAFGLFRSPPRDLQTPIAISEEKNQQFYYSHE